MYVALVNNRRKSLNIGTKPGLNKTIYCFRLHVLLCKPLYIREQDFISCLTVNMEIVDAVT